MQCIDDRKGVGDKKEVGDRKWDGSHGFSRVCHTFGGVHKVSRRFVNEFYLMGNDLVCMYK